MTEKHAAFLSYARADDRYTRNFITGFRTRLAELVQLKTGQRFHIFQDRLSLEWGDHWPSQIDAAIAGALFLIPFVTPSFVRSEACIEEVRKFLALERRQNRKDRILPVYFVDTREFEEDDLRAGHEIADELYHRQYHDLRAFASKSVGSAAVEKELQRLSDKIERSLREGGPAPPRRRILTKPPSSVPVQVRDREPVLADLTALLDQPRSTLIEIVGEPGAGKTAVIAKLFDHIPEPMVLDYLSTHGRPAVSVTSVLSSLAQAHPNRTKRADLLGRAASSDLTLLDRLDEVLRELGSTDVLLVLDNLEVLLDGQRKLRDQPLSTLLEELARLDGHRVRILLSTTKHWASPYVRSLHPLNGLKPPHLEEFVADLGSARKARSTSLSRRDAIRLEMITEGHPRSVELVHDILITQGTSMSGLVAAGRPILDVLVTGLSVDERAVLRAIAGFGRPVHQAAIAHLTDSGTPVAATLESLARRRIVRLLPEDRYLLPTAEAAAFAGSEDLPGLHGRAADYLEATASARPEGVQNLDDLTELLHALDLRIAEGNPDRALDIAFELDTRYLKNWGRSDVLLSPLMSLLPLLSDPDDRVLTGSLIGRALIHVGCLDEAVRVLLAARADNDARQEPERQLVLLTQLAHCHFRDGRIGQARLHYEGGIALTPALDPSIAIPSARLGLAQCWMELGRFAKAFRSVKAARRELAGCEADEAARTELSVQLASCEAAVLIEFGRVPDALNVIGAALEAAESIKADLLMGECHELAARAWQVDDNLTRALRCAEAASAVAASTRNPDLTRSTGVTLATVLLLQGDREAAAAAANAAARYTRSRHVLDILVLHGITSYRTHRIEAAERAFADAEKLADALLQEEPDSYRVLEYRGIALAAISHLHRNSREAEAAEALRTARRLCGELKGTNRQRQGLFRILSDDMAEGALPLIEAVIS
jgi:tetratricopeptide (TPR) repeat protein